MHYILSPLICTIVININCNIVFCTYRKLTAPELEGKEIQWQRTALFFPSPPPWIIEGMSSPKCTNFLKFQLTAVNCLWSLTSSNGAWDDSVPQIQTSFALNILHFLVFLRGKLFYTCHCSFRLLQYSTVIIHATFRGTTVKPAVNINLGSVIYICHWKKKSFLIFFLFFCSEVLHNIKVITFWTRCLIQCLFPSINRIIASEMHRVNTAFWILGLESLHLCLTSKHKLVIPKKVDLSTLDTNLNPR